jgi:hypothetical protein
MTKILQKKLFYYAFLRGDILHICTRRMMNIAFKFALEPKKQRRIICSFQVFLKKQEGKVSLNH